MRRLALVSALLAPLALPACKSERAKLEQLVPDGATGMVSVDAKGLVQSPLWGKLKASAEGAGDAKAKATLDALRNDCKLDPDAVESLVMAFDAFSQGAMGAIRMPNIGTAEALRCVDALAVKEGGTSLWTVGEADGKPTVTAEGGEVQGFALDDDTLVVATKGWAATVQARSKGEGKGAVDGFLAEAVALADRDQHVWMAGEIPALVTPFLDETPAKGVRRVAGSFHFGAELEIRMAAAFADEAAAKATHDQVAPKLDEAKKLAVEQGLPQASVDSLALTVDGAVVRAELTVDLAPLFESSTQAFTGYMNRSKTAEARVNVNRMFDAASAYLMEERLAPGGTQMLTGVCPSDGRPEGETGITPPLTVDCAKGPQGRCTPGGSGDGGYDATLWSEGNVWPQLGFEQQDPHYFHYNFKWKNDLGQGACQFTAQAFGDLDGDGVYSTFERVGSSTEGGMAGASTIAVENELE